MYHSNQEVLLSAIEKNMFLWIVILGHLREEKEKKMIRETKRVAKDSERPPTVKWFIVVRKFTSTWSKQLV